MKKYFLLLAVLSVVSIIGVGCSSETKNVNKEEVKAASMDDSTTQNNCDGNCSGECAKDGEKCDGTCGSCGGENSNGKCEDCGATTTNDKCEKCASAKSISDENVKEENKSDKAKEFTLQGIDGKTYSLKDYQGKKVYVKFWASWCHVCVEGLEETDELAEEKNDFEVLTIVSPNYGGEKNKEDFIKWFKGKNTKNMKVLFDEGGKIASEYGIRAYPTAAYIGSDGSLQQILPGGVDNNTVKEYFKNIK